MALISLAYSVIFLPLIAAIFCLFFSKTKKPVPFFLSTSAILAIIALLVNIAFDISSYQKISNNFNLFGLSIALEFLIDNLSLLFLLLLIILELVVLFYYKNNFESALNKKNRAVFYATFLLNIFAVIGIFTTNELLNLFIFIEIFSLSFLALTSISLQNLHLLRNNFQYYCFAVAAKLIIIFCFLAIFLLLGSGNFTMINKGFGTLAALNVDLAMLIVSLLFFALVINFFPFWIVLKNLYNQSMTTDFALFYALFVKANVGIYILLRLIYFIFGADYVQNLQIIKIAVPILTGLICYFSIAIYFINRFRSLAVHLILANITLILILMIIENSVELKAIFAYLILFNLSGLMIFIFAGFLKSKFGNSTISALKKCSEDHYFVLSVLRITYLMAISCYLLISFFFAGNYFVNVTATSDFEEFFVMIALLMVFLGQLGLLKKLL